MKVATRDVLRALRNERRHQPGAAGLLAERIWAERIRRRNQAVRVAYLPGRRTNRGLPGYIPQAQRKPAQDPLDLKRVLGAEPDVHTPQRQTPMTSAARQVAYAVQSKRFRPTPRQARRIKHKDNRALAAGRGV